MEYAQLTGYSYRGYHEDGSKKLEKTYVWIVEYKDGTQDKIETDDYRLLKILNKLGESDWEAFMEIEGTTYLKRLK